MAKNERPSTDELQTHVWPRLNRYKAAVQEDKSGQELHQLRIDLLAEVTQVMGTSDFMPGYFNSQCDQIEARYLTQAQLREKGLGPFKQ
ncbi:MAG: hypothetical protein K0S38_77 [Candidatus Paceibacter sp.]|jgi:hypothetical protein|nr:hypothetical protein [Candidatus Paceibacter sp.]